MADLQEFLSYVRNFGDFAMVYCLIKCLKTMLCGTMLMPVLLILHKILGRKNAVGSISVMLFLLPMAFMGMSKLFYQQKLIYITAILYQYTKKEYGYVYFGVMLVLVLIYMYKNRQLRKRLTTYERVENSTVMKTALNIVLQQNVSGKKRYLERVKLYLADAEEGPFSGGIIRPYIVLPRTVWNDVDQKSCTVILCHELIHIQSGHILWLTLFKYLTFLWWINPLVYVCEAALREDLELACDESCVFEAGIARYEYGCVLLKMIKVQGNRQEPAAASFLGKSGFALLRRRIVYLTRQRGKNFQAQKSFSARFIGVGMFVVFLGIILTSYPRYTIVKEVAVYDEEVALVAYDTPLVKEAFTVERGKLYVNQEKFEEFVEAEHITDAYVYVSFDTIMKLPGMGGLGNVGMVNVADTEEIFYLSAETLDNRILEFCLKYLI